MKTLLREYLLAESYILTHFCLVLIFSTAFVVTARAQVPVINSFSPTSGRVGTTVTITGTNFNPVAANNIVYFGAVKAPVVSATNASLTVQVPTGTTYKPISITTAGLTGFSFKPFTTTFPVNSTSFSPTSFAPKEDYQSYARFLYSAAIGDLNGDGKPEVIATADNQYLYSNQGGAILIYPNNSFNGAIVLEQPKDYITQNTARGVAVGDLNGDGKPDLVTANSSSNSVSVYLNTSNSTTISFATNVDFTVGSDPINVAIADFNGDGKPDLAVSNGTELYVSVLKNVSTSGSIAFAAKVDYSIDGPAIFVSTGDLDGDGKTDLAVVGGNPGTVSLFRNLSIGGTISFAPKVDFATGGYNETYPQSVAISDLDGDGKLDMAVPNYRTKTVSIFQNTSSIGMFSFQPKIDLVVNDNPKRIGISDLDGDGKPDVAVTSGPANTVSVLGNLSTIGNIAFAPKVDYPTGTGPEELALGDLDGDGKPDIAVANFVGKSLSILRNQLTYNTICTPPTFKNDGTIVLNASCANNDGNITIAPTSGTSPFMYSINGGASYVSGLNEGFTFANLSAGVYKLRLKDANGCESAIVEREIKLNCATTCTPPTFLNNSLIVLDASCADNDGNITIEPTSGTGPFMYSINGGATYVSGPNAGYTFANLGSGLYKLRLKDAKGCESAVVERTVKYNCATCTSPTFLNGPTIVLNASCANNDGNITIEPTSGTGPFMYSINGGASYVSGPNYGYTFANLAAGNYQLRLKDVRGCKSPVVERTVLLNCGACTPPTFKNDLTIILNPSCANNDGIITIEPTRGTSPYMYSKDGGATYVSGPSYGYSFGNLAAGTYRLRLKDARGCESAVLEKTLSVMFGTPCTQTAAAAIITAMGGPLPTEAVSAYPNLTKGQFKLRLKGFISSKTEVSIFNGEGKLVQKRQLNVQPNGIADFDLTGQAKGMYYIKITSNSGTKTSKVLVQ